MLRKVLRILHLVIFGLSSLDGQNNQKFLEKFEFFI